MSTPSNENSESSEVKSADSIETQTSEKAAPAEQTSGSDILTGNNSSATASSEQKKTLAWTGGRYSRKAMNGHFLILFILTVLYEYFVFTNKEGFNNTQLTWEGYWGIFIGVPALLWIISLFNCCINSSRIRNEVQMWNEISGKTKEKTGTSGKNEKTKKPVFSKTCLFFLIVFTVAFCVYMQMYVYSHIFSPADIKIVAALPVLVWLYFILLCVYRIISSKFVLDTGKLLQNRGIISFTEDVTQIADILDIKKKYNLLDKFINGGTGTIILYTADKTDPIIRISGIENLETAFKTISDLYTEFTQKRSIRRVGTDISDVDLS